MAGSTGKTRGTYLAVAAALLFGLAAPLNKRFLTDIPAIEATGLLYLGAGFALGIVWLVQRLSTANGAPRRQVPLTRTDLPVLAASIAFGGLLGPVLLLFGLSQASGIVGSLLLNLEAVFTILIAVVLGESLDRLSLAGTIAITLGSVLVALDQSRPGTSTWLGALAIAGACLAWGVDNNLTHRISERDPVAVVAAKGLFAGWIGLAIAALTGASWPSWSVVEAGLVVGALGYGGSLVCFVLALRRIGTARTGSLFATAPFVGALASVFILKESLSLLTVAAGSVMALGVFLMAKEEHQHGHTHEAQEHDHVHVHDEHHQHEHEGNEGPEPHAHLHAHEVLRHSHPHLPDLHHRHAHGR